LCATKPSGFTVPLSPDTHAFRNISKLCWRLTCTGIYPPNIRRDKYRSPTSECALEQSIPANQAPWPQHSTKKGSTNLPGPRQPMDPTLSLGRQIKALEGSSPTHNLELVHGEDTDQEPVAYAWSRSSLHLPIPPTAFSARSGPLPSVTGPPTSRKMLSLADCSLHANARDRCDTFTRAVWRHGARRRTMRPTTGSVVSADSSTRSRESRGLPTYGARLSSCPSP
jgi:hypothetical protein